MKESRKEENREKSKARLFIDFEWWRARWKKKNCFLVMQKKNSFVCSQFERFFFLFILLKSVEESSQRWWYISAIFQNHRSRLKIEIKNLHSIYFFFLYSSTRFTAHRITHMIETWYCQGKIEPFKVFFSSLFF